MVKCRRCDDECVCMCVHVPVCMPAHVLLWAGLHPQLCAQKHLCAPSTGCTGVMLIVVE